jgi:hypothetical protein
VSISTDNLPEAEPKIMYKVEKFSPAHCPACLRLFQNESADFTVQAILSPPLGLSFLRCTCGNITFRVITEEYIVESRLQAENLLEEGFVNLQEVRASEALQPMHLLHPAADALPKLYEVRR